MKGIAPTTYNDALIKKVKEAIEYYDALAEGYDELYGEEQRRKYFSGLRMLEPSFKVLDVGCGTGLLLECLPEGTYYLGIDVSLGMLRKALLKRGKRLADFVLADAEMLPLRSSSFPTCYSFTALQNLPEPRRGIEEMRRACSKVLVSSLRGKGLGKEGCLEVYPDVMCLIVKE